MMSAKVSGTKLHVSRLNPQLGQILEQCPAQIFLQAGIDKRGQMSIGAESYAKLEILA